jgi:hypothetical protein
LLLLLPDGRSLKTPVRRLLGTWVPQENSGKTLNAGKVTVKFDSTVEVRRGPARKSSGGSYQVGQKCSLCFDGPS